MKGRWLILALAASTTIGLRSGAAAQVAPAKQAQPATAFSGRVLSAAGIPVAEATVYLIPTAAIDMTPITASAVYYPPYPAEAHDEPLEDAIRARGVEFPKATTNSWGRFSIPRVPDGKFFIHVTPATGDTEHLPGGDKSRQAYVAEQLRGKSMDITVSSSPPRDATFVGSTTCLSCHPEFESWKQTGHKISWTPPGAPGPMQDHSRYPEYFKSLAAFKEVDDYTKGTHLELGDRDPKRGSDKFKIRVAGDPRLPIETVYGDVYLWKSKGDGKHYITLVNRLNPNDPNSPSHLEIKLLYGGAVHRQRFVVSVPADLGARQGWYAVLEFHPDANDDRLARERRVWRDYKFYLWWSAGGDGKYGTGDDVITAPPINDNTIQAMCAGCHITGHERYKDPVTGQLLVRAVNDPRGELNIDDDPELDEINIGCETCHGPGSKHLGVPSRYIVNPKYLSAERSSVVCGRCHDRRQGVGGPVAGYTQAINEKGEMMRPGGSRHTMITEYTDPKQKGPVPKKHIWDDDLHPKRPHQQYSDFMKSKLYRNDRQLVTCTDCHNLHGGTPYRRWLIHDPDDSASPLCQRCHAVDMLSHMEVKLNARMKGQGVTHCVDCHMPATAIMGPGYGAVEYGRFIKTPPYKDADEEKNNAYWQGFINAHLFKVPFKTNVGVRGVKPGEAMPTPYTNSCGTCHNVAELPYK